LDLAIYLVLGVVVVVVGVRALSGDRAAAVASRAPADDRPATVSVQRPSRKAVVHVVGAVARPGVYTLKDGQRVRDAVARAGGATAEADLASLNLAGKIVDGQQVILPTQAPAVGVGSTATPGAAPPQVSLAAATVEQLDTLDGVGPATAEKIVAYRTEHGGFRSLDELAEVPGIGPKKLEGLRGQLQP
jgi:competence protein ComEA